MKRILVIEDDLTLRGNTAELLELEGYEVTTATNGRTGLQRIKQNPPDLILCDLRMPEMDGFTLLGHIGQFSKLKRIPFIFFSAKSEKIDIKAGLDAGADDYLTKPFELNDLLASIEKCLHKNQPS
ncbi:response regulator [Maribacter arenosus]|uniref:Response regulator n=1 Tax=Maribacter arenosus TaxID=1854708 RepID=A0ABR7VDR4_9FLAO|nr:response regulator [Maribacter arenosus]MBD0850184.1 response regulator [Maribacter arenosus]